MLRTANEHKSLLKVAEKVECAFPTALNWLKICGTVGLSGFERTFTTNPAVVKAVKTTQDNLIHLLSQSPNIHGLQKVSWTSINLAKVYQKYIVCPCHKVQCLTTIKKKVLRQGGQRKY